MSKELDKLIEAVLREEIKINLADAPDISLPDNPSDYNADDKENSKKALGAQNPTGLSQLAALDGSSDELSVGDLKRAYRIKKMKNPSSRGNKDKEAARARAHAIKKNALNPYKQIAQDIYTDVTSYKGGEEDERLKAKQKVLTQPSSDDLSMDKRNINPFDIDMDDKETVAPGDLPAHNDLDTTKVAGGKANIWKDGNDLALQIKSERSTVAVFRSVPGDTVIEKFKNLAEFAGALQDQTAMDKWMKDHNEFDLVNYATVLANLGDFGKSYGPSSAGFEFEKFLAFFVNLPVVGGTGGAADNIGKVVNGILENDTVFYSAKLFNSFGPKQALGSKEAGMEDKKGIRYICETIGEPIYYIIGMKSTDEFRTLGADEKANIDGNYNYVNIFIVKIEHDKNKEGDPAYANVKRGHVKGYTFCVINSDGKEGTKYPTFQSGNDLYLMGKIEQQRKVAKSPTFEVPVLQLGDNGDELTIRSANFVANKMEEYSKSLSQAIVRIFKRLENLKYNSREYSAAKGKDSKNLQGMAKTGKEYLTAVQKDYKQLNNDYTDMFKAGNDLSQEKTFSGQPVEQNESLKSPLDQLIEAVLKGILK